MGWRLVASIPFGPRREALGEIPEGPRSPVPMVPFSFAVAPDRSFWILDEVKRRVAHYSAEGRFIGDLGGLRFDRFHPHPRDLVIAGLAFESGILRQTSMRGALGSVTLIPLFATIQLRRNTTGAQNYRVGNEVQLNAGTVYPLRDRTQLLLQANAKVRGRDTSADLEDHLFTGGRYLFLSPGLRFDAGHGAAWYAMLQVPLYQHVNGIQLTAKRNLVTGVQMRF